MTRVEGRIVTLVLIVYLVTQLLVLPTSHHLTRYVNEVRSRDVAYSKVIRRTKRDTSRGLQVSFKRMDVQCRLRLTKRV